MNFKEIQELIRLVDKLKIASFDLKQGDTEISIKTQQYIEAKNKSNQTVALPVSPATQPAPVVIPQQVSASAPASASSPVAEAPKEKEKSNLVEIKAPMVGTFYRSPSPDKPPYVQVGDEIKVGTPLCIIEAMKLFNEIESEMVGRIVKILVEDSKPVEYDQPLFLVEPL